jgi:hypothetical protein
MIRFTIRDVLWLTVVVAMGCAWWIVRDAAAKHRAESEAQILSLQKENKALQSRNAAILKGVYFMGMSVQETGGGKFEFRQRRDANSN